MIFLAGTIYEAQVVLHLLNHLGLPFTHFCLHAKGTFVLHLVYSCYKIIINMDLLGCTHYKVHCSNPAVTQSYTEILGPIWTIAVTHVLKRTLSRIVACYVTTVQYFTTV